jgi:hypothetical protein
VGDRLECLRDDRLFYTPPATAIEITVEAMWRAAAWRGRAGQAFVLSEPGVADGTIADSLAADQHAPQQDGQAGKSKLLARSGLRILVQSLRANASTRIKQPTAGTARLAGQTCSRMGWTFPRPTPIEIHLASNTRSGR